MNDTGLARALERKRSLLDWSLRARERLGQAGPAGIDRDVFESRDRRRTKAGPRPLLRPAAALVSLRPIRPGALRRPRCTRSSAG